MESAEVTSLDRECLALSRYLIKQTPNDYVIEKYRDAHKFIAGGQNEGNADFDGVLLKAARKNRWMIRLVDCYCRIFFPTCLIRRKAVLLLAILEMSPPMHVYFDRPDNCHRAILCARMVGRLVSFVTVLCLSIIIFGPMHLTYKLRKGTSKDD